MVIIRLCFLLADTAFLMHIALRMFLGFDFPFSWALAEERGGESDNTGTKTDVDLYN